MLVKAQLSQVGDGAVKAALVMARCCYQVMLATVLPSHVANGVVEVTWPWRNVDAESCWQWCCQAMLVMALLR
jgi:hypothetical protein